jgi:glutathione S-transferase
VKLYDAARCPYCARVRIALAEKGIVYDRVEIDLRDRPDWLYELNPLGKVPVLEDGALVLPESAVIIEYLEEREPSPRLLPDDMTERARARLHVYRFDDLLGRDYYAFRRGDRNALDQRLADLPVGWSLFVDVAYVPWVIRAREQYAVQLPERLASWLTSLEERPAVAAELDLVRALA